MSVDMISSLLSRPNAISYTVAREDFETLCSSIVEEVVGVQVPMTLRVLEDSENIYFIMQPGIDLDINTSLTLQGLFDDELGVPNLCPEKILDLWFNDMFAKPTVEDIDGEQVQFSVGVNPEPDMYCCPDCMQPVGAVKDFIDQDELRDYVASGYTTANGEVANPNSKLFADIVCGNCGQMFSIPVVVNAHMVAANVQPMKGDTYAKAVVG